MNETLTSKYMRNGYRVVNGEIFNKIDARSQENILANLLRDQQKLRHVEQDALIALIGNFQDLRKIIANYPGLDEKRKSIIYLMLTNLCDKFKEFYRYSLYLQYEKKSYKNQMAFNKKVINIVKGESDNLDLQSRKVLESELTDEAREIYHNSTLLQKGFNYQQSLMDEAMQKYSFYDYVDLLDSELDVLGRAFANMKLPEDLIREITSWYHGLEKQIEHQITKVNLVRTHYVDYCAKYGLKPVRNMKKKDYIISLLKLYNPNKKIDYDFLSDTVYMPVVSDFRLPNGFTIDHVRQELRVDIFEQPVVLNIGQNYTLDSFTSKMQEINPKGYIRIEKNGEEYTIVSDIKLDDLILPMEFDIKIDPITNRPNINNNYSGQTEKLSFGYHYAPKRTKPKEKSKSTVNSKTSPTYEAMQKIVELNGPDKVMIINGRLLTTVKKIKDFKLPEGFYNDVDRNITNKKFVDPENVILITIRYVKELPKRNKIKPKKEITNNSVNDNNKKEETLSIKENPVVKEPKLEEKVEKTETKVEPKIGTKDEIKTEVKTEPIVEPKVETKDEIKTEVKTEPIVESKVETKDEIKTEVKTEPIVESKVETKVERKKVVEVKKSRRPKNKKAKRIAIGLMKVLGNSVKTIGIGTVYGILTPLSWLLNKMKTMSADSMHNSFNQLQRDYEEIIMQTKHLALPIEQQKEFERQLNNLGEELKNQEKRSGYGDSVGEYSLDDILSEYQERGKGR